jgi:hypothetical protein
MVILLDRFDCLVPNLLFFVYVYRSLLKLQQRPFQQRNFATTVISSIAKIITTAALPRFSPGKSRRKLNEWQTE